jgi:hypothetical protein
MKLPRSVSALVESLDIPSQRIPGFTTLGRPLPIEVESPTWLVTSNNASKSFSMNDSAAICDFVVSCYRSGIVAGGVEIICQPAGVVVQISTLDDQVGAREMEICRAVDEIYEDTKRLTNVPDYDERLLEVAFGRSRSTRR